MSDAQTVTADEIELNDERPSRMKTAAQWSGYSLFFLFALLISLILNFPNRQLKSFVEGQARRAGYPMSIESLRLTGLSSITMSGVKLTLPASKPKPGAAPVAPAVLRLDELEASTALWALLTRQEIDAEIDVRVGGGSIEGGRIKVTKGAVKKAPSKRSKKGKR